MRTTLTLDADLAAALRRDAAERQCSFKQVVNEAIRRGLRGAPAKSLPTSPSFDLGGPVSGVDLDHTSRLLGDLEDEELKRKRSLGK